MGPKKKMRPVRPKTARDQAQKGKWEPCKVTFISIGVQFVTLKTFWGRFREFVGPRMPAFQAVIYPFTQDV